MHLSVMDRVHSIYTHAQILFFINIDLSVGVRTTRE